MKYSRPSWPDFCARLGLALFCLLGGILMAWLAGCAHRESQRSRDLLNCVYSCQYGPGLTPAQRNACVEACR